MRGVYTATYRITGLSAARTLMYLKAPADKVLEILSASVTNEGNETNEQLLCTLQRITTEGTPTATAVTPARHEPGDQAAGATVKANVTASEPTYTADTEIGREGFSSLGGWYFDPTPEERPIIPGQGLMGLRLISTPAAFDGVAKITWREIG
jgi:hypothetical protein